MRRTRIPRAVFRESHSGLTALEFLRGTLKILQRLKQFFNAETFASLDLFESEIIRYLPTRER